MKRDREVLSTRVQIPESAFVAENCTLVGQVSLGEHASVWFQTVLRGDTEGIRLGNRTNVQDGSIVHVDPGFPVEIGSEVTVGHGAVIHGARIEDRVLVGMRAVILNGAVVGRYSIIGAGALVTEKFKVPEGCLVLGVPGAVVRKLRPAEIDRIVENARVYVEMADAYRSGRVVPARRDR